MPTNEANAVSSDPAAEDLCAKSIVDAWRFLERVGEQIEALRDTINERLPEYTGISKNWTVAKKTNDKKMGKSEWMYQSTIDTFKLYKKDRNSLQPETPDAYCQFQISIAHSEQSTDNVFFPHVAVLVTRDASEWKWLPWDCEEFQLNADYLDTEQNDGDGRFRFERIQNQDRRWRIFWNGDHYNDALTVFVVPLVELHNEDDVDWMLLEPAATLLNKTNGAVAPDSEDV